MDEGAGGALDSRNTVIRLWIHVSKELIMFRLSVVGSHWWVVGDLFRNEPELLTLELVRLP